MNKIYGYKERDILGLAKFLEKRGSKPLTETFFEYAKLSGKAKGTVRNLYYALAKRSREDKEFCDKFLGGKPLEVQTIEGFSEAEEREVIKRVLLGQNEGRSVRSVIMEITEGDAKKALRYQNKYRNALKNKPNLIAELLAELKIQSPSVNKPSQEMIKDGLISDVELKKIKSEINGLVGRIALKTHRENLRLKERVNILERENLRLSNLLYAEGKSHKAIRYFRSGKGENMIN